MLYERLIDWKVYPPQSLITFPRYTESTINDEKGNEKKIQSKPGFGTAIFMLTPNVETTFSLIDNPNMAFRQSLYKYYILDSIYKEKIGQKNLVLNENQKNKKLIPEKFKLKYIPRASVKSIINKEKNCVIDLGRWMELFFTYFLKKPAKIRCEAFINFLSNKINDHNYDNYNKILFIDILSWVDSSKECVVMNPRLLNNPLSIFIYSMYKYPELLKKLRGIRIYLINSGSKQVFLFNSNDLNKEMYPKYKSRLKLMKNITISEDEELNDNQDIKKLSKPTIKTKAEINAEIKEELKTEIIKSITSNLVGPKKENKAEFNNEDGDDFSFLDDSDFDITEDLDVNSDEEDIDNGLLDEEDLKEIENRISNGENKIDIIKDMSNKTKIKMYLSGFKPSRTPEQEEKIKRMAEIQDMALSIPENQEKEILESKKIDEEDFSSYISTTNPNIQKSSFVNFDKNYNEKKMPRDIDNAVACLSNANNKIFVTNKEEADSSDSMNLKKTLTYSLQDERGNKMTVEFDIPTIIDNNYIYINGTKKVIGHQFILKPLVKTGPDTVQLVTHYNKAFITRDGRIDQLTNNIIKYIEKNKDIFKPISGNSSVKNDKYTTSLDFSIFSKILTSFQYNDYKFYTEIDKCIHEYHKLYPSKPKYEMDDISFPVGINTKTKEIITINSTTSFSNYLISIFDEKINKDIGRMKGKPNLIYARIKLMGRPFPLIVVMLYCEGFKAIMEKARINYNIIDPASFKHLDKLKYDYLPLRDKILTWEREDLKTMLLMNGMKKFDFSIYSAEELESKDTYRDIVEAHYGNASINYKLDQFYDFTIDEVTKEILTDMGYPTNLIELLILAVGLLCDNSYKQENNMTNMRIRSNEVISNIVYKRISDAYVKYRKTAHKKKPAAISIKQSCIIDDLISSDTNLIEEFSVINPVLEIEKARAVTYKGLRGIQLDRAITLPKRGYDPSMLGVLGISTPPDANVGINRQLTLEPKITSTRGYIDAGSKETVEDLNSANLLTPSELLTPLGVIHDDPDRTAIKKCLLVVAV